MAQFGRALRSGRRGRKFESCRLDWCYQQRHGSWPHGQAVKTTPSHGVNPGSIPGEVIRCKMLWSDSEHLFLWEKAGVFDIFGKICYLLLQGTL